MDALLSLMSPTALALAALVTVVAAFVKGAVGFALPVIMISGMASFLPADLALAGLIVPTLLGNLMQVSRGGLAPAWRAMVAFRRYLAVVLVAIALSAQLIVVLSDAALYLIVGGPVAIFAALQLAGWRPQVPTNRRGLADLGVGAFAGFTGGLSGVWGPPTVAYLTAIDTPKTESIRVQGVVYTCGSVILLLSHLRSGVLDAETLPFSLALVVPMAIGMVLGFLVQDRLNQTLFRRAVLVVLIAVGLNLVRRGIIGLI